MTDPMVQQIFDAIEPPLEAAGFHIDEGDDDTICMTHVKSGQTVEIHISY